MPKPSVSIIESSVTITYFRLKAVSDQNISLKEFYLGDPKTAIYLIRPYQNVAARWTTLNKTEIREAIKKSLGYVA